MPFVVSPYFVGRGVRTTSENFQSLATQALIHAELPAQFLFEPAQDILPSPSTHNHTTRVPAAPPPEPFRRPPPRPKHAQSRGKATFLYVAADTLSTTTEWNEPFLLLKCPHCGRTAFSSLQGLLNHARISHSIEWGTHDACIKACAVEEPGLNVEEGNEVGSGPTGILPGLQTIFQRAVGVGPAQPALMPPHPTPGVEPTTSEDVPEVASARTPSAAPKVTQILGIHEETPALAPFLGKQARRREIRVIGEEEDVQITHESNQSKPTGRPTWRMNFAPRHHALSEQPTESLGVGAIVETHSREETPSGSALTTSFVPSGKSRFHFSARVTISDRSLFVGPGCCRFTCTL